MKVPSKNYFNYCNCKQTAPPSPPGRPVVIDITETRCTLRWEPSEDDGGADVKHYIVEYFRDVWDVWLKAKTTKECQVCISNIYSVFPFATTSNIFCFHAFDS